MGWTSYHAIYYKNGNVDRKRECDAYFEEGLNRGHFKIVKSAMVGSVYYAAVQSLRRYVGKDDNGNSIYEPIPENEVDIWAAVFLTSVNNKDYYNFYYKDMDESVGPCECKCPSSILNLLSDTENQQALQWRQKCREYNEAANAKRKNPYSLNKLPIGSSITFECPFNSNCGVKKGDRITLSKVMNCGKAVWSDGVYKWKRTLIPAEYQVLSA